MELDIDIAALAVVTCCVGYLMVLAGVGKSALEWKRRQRICPSCGRAIQARVCSACRSAT
jgi:NADH pyrophosphatase NudC (nudix superfamily)